MNNPSGATARVETAAPVAAKEAFPFELVPQFGHGLSIEHIAISPDGKVAASASADKTVRVWDVRSGILLRQLSIRDQVKDVAILRDGRHAVVVLMDKVQLWDIVRGRFLGTLTPEQPPALRISLLHNSDRAVIGLGLGGIELWNLDPPKLVRRLAEKRGWLDSVPELDVSPDDRLVAASGKDGKVLLIDVESGRLVGRLTGHQREVRAARFSRNGERLVSFGEDGTIRLWDVRSGTGLRSCSFGGPIVSGALVDDDTVLVGGTNGAAALVDLKTGQLLRTLAPWPGVPFYGVTALAVTPDGRQSVVADNKAAILFSNLSDGTPIHATAQRRAGPFSLAVSPRGDKVAVGFGGVEVEVWDSVLGERVRRIPNVNNDHGVNSVAFSPDGRLLLRASDQALSIWDVRSGELIRQAKAPKPFTAWSLAVSPDGQLAAVGGYGSVAVFEIETGRHLWTASHEVTVNAEAFTLDSSQLVAGSENHDTRIYGARDGTLIRRFEGPTFGLDSIEMLDRDTAMLGALDVLGIWDLRSGRKVRQFLTPREGAGPGAFSVDHKWAFCGGRTGSMMAFNGQNGRPLGQYSAHVDTIKTIVPSPDGKLVFSTSFDGTIRVTPVETLTSANPNGDPRPMAWISDGDEWLAYSADGYFDASRRGGGLVAAVLGLEGFRVDQLAVRNNRPDVALGRIGLGTTEALSLFANRYQQRLRRLGYKESDLSNNLLSAPRAEIVDFSRVGSRARLRCTFTGNGRSLRRSFVFINDVAVGDGEGVPLSGTDATVDFEFELSSGRNKVEVSVLNDVGVESPRDVRTANVTDPVRANLYYLGFGISKYADPRLALKFAHKDAIDLGRAIEQMQGRGFDRVVSRVLTDSAVTKASIAAARAFLVQAKVDDTVVVFVAGHGVFGQGPSEQYYFVTHDTDLARIHETGAGFGLLEDLVTGIPARKKLLLLDTCESGERDADEEVVRVSAGQSRGLAARGIRPVVLNAGAASSVPRRSMGYQDRFIFNDLARRSGAIVFSASHGTELSYEDDRLKNGMFTYEMVQALTGPSADTDRNGLVTTDELRAYVSRAVSSRTGGLQNPTVDRDNIEALFGFPIPGGAAGQFGR